MPPFTVFFTASFQRDIDRIPTTTAFRIIDRANKLKDGLTGDIKKLNDFEPPYRLRVGDYRVLFDIEGQIIRVRRVIHRKDAYR